MTEQTLTSTAQTDKYAISSNEVEKHTEINFLPNIMTRELERELEAQINIDYWTFSKKKFDLRVNKWNKE